ncbi:hypothetical protein [Vibrio sp.]|uniref:hypothetical protein n=1 Tax=Vibrio sp. TaxID=678 RepID=UPI0037BA2BC5
MSDTADLLLQRPELEAIVLSVDDPDGMLRVQVRIFGLFDDVPDHDQPWATYKLPVGARVGEGDFTPVHEGDLVWIDFPYYMHSRKDTRRPRITGSIHHCPEKVPNLPAEAFKGEGVYQHKRSHKEPKPVAQDYHSSRVYIMHGIMVEYEKGGVYRVTHQASGTGFEFDARGHSVLHTEGDNHRSSTGDSEDHTGKNLNETVGGFWKIKVTGTAHIDGKSVHLNEGKGVVQGDCLCAFTGKPHSDLSTTVTAGK